MPEQSSVLNAWSFAQMGNEPVESLWVRHGGQIIVNGGHLL